MRLPEASNYILSSFGYYTYLVCFCKSRKQIINTEYINTDNLKFKVDYCISCKEYKGNQGDCYGGFHIVIDNECSVFKFAEFFTYNSLEIDVLNHVYIESFYDKVYRGSKLFIIHEDKLVPYILGNVFKSGELCLGINACTNPESRYLRFWNSNFNNDVYKDLKGDDINKYLSNWSLDKQYLITGSQVTYNFNDFINENNMIESSIATDLYCINNKFGLGYTEILPDVKIESTHIEFLDNQIETDDEESEGDED